MEINHEAPAHNEALSYYIAPDGDISREDEVQDKRRWGVI